MRHLGFVFGILLCIAVGGQADAADEFCSCSCEYQAQTKRFESWFNCDGKKHHSLSSHPNYFECQSYIMSSPTCRPHEILSDETEKLNMQLLKSKQDELGFVCKNAKRPMAIVVRKTHYCDNTPVKQCMLVGSILNDSCNRALQNQFSLFHIRRGKYEYFDHGNYLEYPDQSGIADYWDGVLKNAGKSTGPGLILIDTQKCKVIGNVFLYDVSILGDREGQLRALNQKIYEALDREFKSLDLLKLEINEFKTCANHNPRQTLSQMWEAMNLQAQE